MRSSGESPFSCRLTLRNMPSIRSPMLSAPDRAIEVAIAIVIAKNSDRVIRCLLSGGGGLVERRFAQPSAPMVINVCVEPLRTIEWRSESPKSAIAIKWSEIPKCTCTRVFTKFRTIILGNFSLSDWEQ